MPFFYFCSILIWLGTQEHCDEKKPPQMCTRAANESDITKTGLYYNFNILLCAKFRKGCKSQNTILKRDWQKRRKQR